MKPREGKSQREGQRYSSQEAGAMRARPKPGGAPATEGERVIVIRWPLLALPLLIIGVLAAGYWAGRSAARARHDSTSANAWLAAQTVEPVATSASGLVLVDPSTGARIVPVEPSGVDLYGSDRAIDLPPPMHPLLNQPAPDFTMPLLGSEQSITLSDLRGKPVMINFWATWCPPCRHEMPWIESVYGTYRDQGLEVLAVNAGEKVSEDRAAATVTAFVELMGLSFPVLFADLATSLQVQREYSVSGLPATYFVDATGRVTDLHTGMFPNQPTLELKVRRLLGLPPNTVAP